MTNDKEPLTNTGAPTGDTGSPASDTGSPAKAGRREWTGLAVIALPCILYSMDLTVLNLALPHISKDLHPTSSELLWIVDIYGFMLAGLLITMGTLGDRIGRRRLLMTGAVAFGIASVGAAFATSAGMLIAARAILGIAGATLAPSTLSLIRNMFHDPKQRTIAIGVWITSYSVGGAIGPLIGGVLLEHFWWGSVFLISVPVMVLLLLVGPALLPEYRNPVPGRMDLFSASLSLVAVLSVIFGIKKFAENGPGWLPVWCIVAGIITGMIFLRRQKGLSDPLIDLKLFRRAQFSVSLLIYTFATFIAFGFFIFTFQYMQLVIGLTPIKAGLWSIPFFCAFIIGSMITPAIVSRVQPAYVMGVGLFLAAIGFGMLTQMSEGSGPAFLIIGSFIYCLGLAPVFTLTTDIIVGAAPPERSGSASAISETGSEFGGALGIAIIGSVGIAIYRSQMVRTMPKGIPSYTKKAAMETLSGAVAEARQLPPELRQSLLDAASGSFTSGMRWAAFICGIVAISLAILSVTRLRRVHP